jgi:hypothetical protein
LDEDGKRLAAFDQVHFAELPGAFANYTQ